MKIRISQKLLNGLFGRLRVGQETRSYLLYEKDKKALFQLSRSCFDNSEEWKYHLAWVDEQPEIAITARYSEKHARINISIFTNYELEDPHPLFVGWFEEIKNIPNPTAILELATGCFLEEKYVWILKNCLMYIRNHFGFKFQEIQFRSTWQV